MRKLFAAAGIVFVTTFAIGATLPKADAISCRYRCICSVPHKCCTTNGVETCKPVSNSPIQCPQSFPC
jgi:hypothetical protein